MARNGWMVTEEVTVANLSVTYRHPLSPQNRVLDLENIDSDGGDDGDGSFHLVLKDLQVSLGVTFPHPRRCFFSSSLFRKEERNTVTTVT